ncbi:MAG TPA: glycoside hydrolase family 97 catalytic domain-containing protein [Vicinamibacteria bacterium]
MRPGPALLAALFAGAPLPAAAAVVRVESPSGHVRLTLSDAGGRLVQAVTVDGRPVLDASPLGLAVDGVDLGAGARLGAAQRYRTDHTYPWRGVHATAVDRSRGARVSVAHAASGTTYTLDVRAYDDGVAFRFVVPGAANRGRVADAATTFVVPAGSTVWYHGLNAGHYEDLYARKPIEDVRSGEWGAPPVTFRLPGGRGYAAITESALLDYAGMALQADGARGLRVRLAHDAPASYPFRLRYGHAEEKRLAAPAAIEGTITTPWRVVLIGRDLDALVNSDVVPNLAPPPDAALFPQGFATPWLRPGRAVWRYLDGGENTVEGIKEFTRLAAELGFEHHVVEGQWQRWSEADLRHVIADAREKGVGIWLWRHSRLLVDPQERRAFFKMAQDVGAAGVKVDFLDHEAREVIQRYHAILRDAAEHRLMVNFHGANKPAGEARTWPNELTREAVRGLEYGRTEAWAAHNATLPFTRMLAGHADYTPVVFGERRKETSWAHQVATAAVFTSPLLVYGGHPQSLLASPAREMIRAIPSVWDETVVLPGSAIGEVAALARRRGQTWFVAVVNGPEPRTLRVDLAFLKDGPYRSLQVRDDPAQAASLEVETGTARGGDVLTVALRGAGGFVARFVPEP